MIELMRADKHITLTVEQDGKHWHLRLEDHDNGTVGDGHGATFDQAREDIIDRRLRPKRAS